jgi:dienelactone hydrolase
VRRHLLTLTAAAIACLAAAAPASATTLPDSFSGACPTYGDQQICSGSVPSFDGTKLDVDLTLPTTGGQRHPLIVMLHGFGDDKHEWESTTDEGDGADKYHWNNRWFAEHGYYVLTYTARGFSDDGADEDTTQPPTPREPSGSIDLPRGTIHLKSRDWEIRETQWLAALVAAAYSDVDAHRIAVTGGSYGGIESWLQASQRTWTFPHSLDPTLPVLDLQAAVPKYPSTDLRLQPRAERSWRRAGARRPVRVVAGACGRRPG